MVATYSGGSSTPGDVDFKCLALQRMEPDFWLVDALYGGTRSMRDAKKDYLPQRMKEPEPFYNVRLASSFLYAALKDTVDGIVAKPFSKKVDLGDTLPEPLLSMQDDCDGTGTRLDALLADVFRDAWKYGLCHVFVDYPRRPEVEKTLLEEGKQAYNVPRPESNAAERETVRPRFIKVCPANLLGWRYKVRGSQRVLTQVRFQEKLVEPDGEYGEVEVTQVRVVEEATFRIYRKFVDPATKTAAWIMVDEGVNSLGKVPLVTYYVEQVGWMEGRPPLLDLAWLNTAHWQSSSIQRNSLDIARIPVLVKAGFMDADDAESDKIGSSSIFRSNDPNAKAYYCEHSGAAIAAGERDLATLRENMEVLGLQPWMQRDQGATATGIASNDEKAECRVQTAVRALEASVKRMFGLAAEWAGVALPDDFAADIFDDFGISPDRVADVDFLIRARQAKLISSPTFLEEIQKRKVISEDVDLDEEQKRLDDEGPDLSQMLGGFGDQGFGKDPKGTPFGGDQAAGDKTGDAKGDAPSNRRTPTGKGATQFAGK